MSFEVIHPVVGSGDIIPGDPFIPKIKWVGSLNNWTYPSMLVDYFTKIEKTPYDPTKMNYSAYLNNWNMWGRVGNSTSLEYHSSSITVPEDIIEQYINHDPSDPNPSQGWSIQTYFMGQAGFSWAFVYSYFNFDYEIPGVQENLGSFNTITSTEELYSGIEFGGLEWMAPNSFTNINIDDALMALVWRERKTASTHGVIKIELQHPDETWSTLTEDARTDNSNVIGYVPAYQTVGEWEYSSASLLFNNISTGSYKLKITRYEKDHETGTFSLYFEVKKLSEDSLATSSSIIDEKKTPELKYTSDNITILSAPSDDPVYEAKLKEANDTLAVISQISEILDFLKLAGSNVNYTDLFSSSNLMPLDENISEKLDVSSSINPSQKPKYGSDSTDSIQTLSNIAEHLENLRKASQAIIYESLPVFQNTYPFERYSDDTVGVSSNATIEDVINWKKGEASDSISVASEHPYRDIEYKKSDHSTDNLSIIPSLISYIEWATFALDALATGSSVIEEKVTKKSENPSDSISITHATVEEDYSKKYADTLDKLKAESEHFPSLLKLFKKLTDNTITSLEFFSDFNINAETKNPNDILNIASILNETQNISAKSNVANSAISALSFITHLKNFGNVCKYILGLTPVFTPTISEGAYALSSEDIKVLQGFESDNRSVNKALASEVLAMNSLITNTQIYFIKQYIPEDILSMEQKTSFATGSSDRVYPNDTLHGTQDIKTILHLLKVSNLISTSYPAFTNKYATLKSQSDILSALSELTSLNKIEHLDPDTVDYIGILSSKLTDKVNKKPESADDKIGFISFIHSFVQFLADTANINNIISEDTFASILRESKVKNSNDFMEIYSVISDMYTVAKKNDNFDDILKVASVPQSSKGLVPFILNTSTMNVISATEALIEALKGIIQSVSNEDTFSNQIVSWLLRYSEDSISIDQDIELDTSLRNIFNSNDFLNVSSSKTTDTKFKVTDSNTDTLRFFQQISFLTNMQLEGIFPLLSIDTFAPSNIIAKQEYNTDYIKLIGSIQQAFNTHDKELTSDQLSVLSEEAKVLYDRQMIPAIDNLKAISTYINEKKDKIKNYKNSILEIRADIEASLTAIRTKVLSLTIEDFFQNALSVPLKRRLDDKILPDDGYQIDLTPSVDNNLLDQVKLSDSSVQDKKNRKLKDSIDFIKVDSDSSDNFYSKINHNIPMNLSQIKVIDLVHLYNDIVRDKIESLSYSEYFSSTVELLGSIVNPIDMLSASQETSSSKIVSLSNNSEDILKVLQNITSDINDRLEAINYLDSRLDAILILDEVVGGLPYQVPFRDNNIGSVGGRINLPWYTGQVSNTRSNKIKSQVPVRLDSSDCLEIPMTNLPEKINSIMINYNDRLGTPGKVHLYANDVALYSLEMGEQVVIPLGGDSTNKGLDPSNIKLSVDNYLEDNISASIDVRVLGNRSI